MIHKRFTPKEIQIAGVEPIIGSYTGPGLVSEFFYGNQPLVREYLSSNDL